MAHSTGLRASKIFLMAAFWGLLAAGEASALTVSGIIRDSNGDPVPEIKVCVMDYNPGFFDSERECVYTNSAGRYSSSKVKDKDDPYLLVYYESPIHPTLAPGKKVKAVHDSSSSTLTFSTANHLNGYYADITADTRINVPSAPGEPALGPEVNGIKAVREVFAYIASQGVPNFTFDSDVTLDIRVAKPDYWPSASGSTKTINCGINKTDQWATFYHEMGHLIQYSIYNPERYPKTAYPGWHHMTSSHSDEGFALTEGWAEGLQILVSGFTGKGSPSLYWNIIWRGAGGVRPGETGDYTHLGEDTGSDNSGEVVEGSIANIIANPKTSFRAMMEGLLATNPERYWDLLRGYIGRATPAAITNIFPSQRENGIVYSRAKFTGFEETAPAGTQMEDGNFAVIDHIAFIRGKIHPRFEQVNAAALNLASGQLIDIEKIQMGWHEAENGLNDQYPDVSFRQWTPEAAFRSSSIVFDSVNDLTYDRDLDLILRVKDIHGSLDDFNPSFKDDPKPSNGKDYSSNERWLKHLQTWYNQDDYADNDDEGKVIVDNNAPILDEKTLKPAVDQRKSWITGGDGTYVRISPPGSKS